MNDAHNPHTTAGTRKPGKKRSLKATTREDVHWLVRKCESYQGNAKIQRQPAEPLEIISGPWPFSTWGVDLLSPFLITTTQKMFILVVVDYFTKWIEAEALAIII
ncbi:rve domain-containing protein/RVT_3 domain-containing protein [Gossypium australe]|uniref:Rve domain-containing protein/RVT_3 domain-containing protein n=1 Tax=Gossypium australe TaxID=47621 RepID=A0A5B6VPJ7_9ROSI|nr:rve domain-containing protein/RVT_3 domain-containing protein [Gossypium australe]